MLIELHERTDAIAKPRRSSGLFHFAILVPSRAALGTIAAAAGRRSGGRISGAADHLVSEALYLDDPDGLGIEIYRDRPRDAWRMRQRGAGDGDRSARSAGDSRRAGRRDAVERARVRRRSWATCILHVPHLDTAEALYCGRIGFEPMVRRYPGALFVAAGGYHHHLGLNTWSGVGAPPPPENAVGLRSFTIESAAVQPQNVLDEATRRDGVAREGAMIA